MLLYEINDETYKEQIQQTRQNRKLIAVPGVWCPSMWVGVQTQKNKKNFVPQFKKDKKIFSWDQDVGVCHCITGTRFPYYISSSTIWWERGNGTLLVQIEPKNKFQTEKVKDGYEQLGYLPPTPHVSTSREFF